MANPCIRLLFLITMMPILRFVNTMPTGPEDGSDLTQETTKKPSWRDSLPAGLAQYLDEDDDLSDSECNGDQIFCNICHEKFSEKRPDFGLICGHTFHERCLIQYGTIGTGDVRNYCKICGGKLVATDGRTVYDMLASKCCVCADELGDHENIEMACGHHYHETCLFSRFTKDHYYRCSWCGKELKLVNGTAYEDLANQKAFDRRARSRVRFGLLSGVDQIVWKMTRFPAWAQSFDELYDDW